MNRDDILRKIKKCLELAKSANEFEAAAAMRQAQALMREHATAEDVQMMAITEVQVRAVSQAMVVWEAALTRLIAQAFACEVYTARRFDDAFTRRERWVVFVGIEAAPAVAGYAYEVLGRQCVKSRTWYIGRQSKRCKSSTKTARGDEFARGWVQAVRGLVENMAMPAADAQLVQRYMDLQHPDLTTSEIVDRGRRVEREGHADAGFRVGKRARLERGVDGPMAQPMLGHSGDA
ncbi:DUF7168 domain-containing protein [Burkholderia gladioli]|uniref:DUF7168 domain-containing protein n=1 Tax=Burkholderia gladioli TaxID=28095 RepID=UPI000CDA7096|nr:DUF2786 domain-containing protein [Burkholderia gladioli]POS08038.1 hypothetical protein C3Y08_11120 [Burkholderia gladioli]